jgi:hypothetical protein
VGQGEDQMKVPAGQKLCSACIKPLFLGHGLALGTVPVAARVVGRLFIGAVLASVQMTAQGGGAADFDQVQNLTLLGRDGELLTVLISVTAEGIGHLTWASDMISPLEWIMAIEAYPTGF